MTPRVVGASYSYGFHSDTFVRQVPGRVSTVCFAEDHSLALVSFCARIATRSMNKAHQGPSS